MSRANCEAGCILQMARRILDEVKNKKQEFESKNYEHYHVDFKKGAPRADR